MTDQPGIGSYAGGQTCPACDRAVNVVDSYCRYCGAQLRESADQEDEERVMTDGGSDVCSDGRKGLIGVPAEQVDLVAFDRTPFPYWLADLVELSCPNCPDVWRTVNEMLVPQYSGLTCAECGSEVSRHV